MFPNVFYGFEDFIGILKIMLSLLAAVTFLNMNDHNAAFPSLQTED